MKILITAGPTCEDIDDVRYITNRSSGRMGIALAEEAHSRGHEVTLVCGPINMELPDVKQVIQIRSAAELNRACLDIFPEVDAVIAAAAVADYTPAERHTGKMKKKEDDLVLRLVRTPDTLKELGRQKSSQVLIGIALEVDRPRENAEKKLRDKCLDAIVLNAPESFGAQSAGFSVLRAGGTWQELGTISKRELAVHIVDIIEQAKPAS